MRGSIVPRSRIGHVKRAIARSSAMHEYNVGSIGVSISRSTGCCRPGGVVVQALRVCGLDIPGSSGKEARFRGRGSMPGPPG